MIELGVGIKSHGGEEAFRNAVDAWDYDMVRRSEGKGESKATTEEERHPEEGTEAKTPAEV